MREDALLQIKLINQKGSPEGLRSELEKGIPASGPAISTSQDLPLSHEARRVLSRAAEAAEKLNHPSIDSGHLVLGVFEMKGKAAAALDHQGVTYHAYQEALAASIDPAKPQAAAEASGAGTALAPEAVPARETVAPSLREPVSKLSQLIDQTADHLTAVNENFGYHRLKRKEWTRKEALGHLIDWAALHHGWFARALTEPKLAASGYPEDGWVTAQRYTEVSWTNLVGLWVSLNQLIVHLLQGVPEEKLGTSCRIGIEEPKALKQLIAGYIEHCEDMVGQILARG